MGNELAIEQNEFEQLAEQFNLPEERIKQVYSTFTDIDKNNRGYILKDELVSHCNLPRSELVQRVLDTLTGPKGNINFPKFLEIIALIENGSEEDKIKCKKI